VLSKALKDGVSKISKVIDKEPPVVIPEAPVVTPEVIPENPLIEAVKKTRKRRIPNQEPLPIVPSEIA
jgi:hypothetical protein